MVTVKEYTFSNVTSAHTISAEFTESPTPVEDEIVRMFIKVNGTWVPLFEEA